MYSELRQEQILLMVEFKSTHMLFFFSEFPNSIQSTINDQTGVDAAFEATDELYMREF